MNYTLPQLPYAYDALEPYIDAKTMGIHHLKHHQAYIDKLNEALAKHPELDTKNVEDFLQDINAVPADIKAAVRNHGGGHVNHSLFWELLSPKQQELSGELAESIKKAFGSFDKFKKQFSDAALTRFGSGWAWLVSDKGRLAVTSTANQDSPLMEGMIPLLGLDVWEHAYYLNYHNRRNEYIAAFWNIVNWSKVEELYQQTIKKK